MVKQKSRCGAAGRGGYMGTGNLPLHNFRHIHILHGYQSSEVIQRANKLQLGTEFGTERKKGIGTDFGAEKKRRRGEGWV